jgi:undecaprenyl-diphosphatase
LDSISAIKDIDTQLFLFLNSKHNDFFDGVMYWSSHKYFWIPLYVFFFYLAYRQVGKRVWLVALAAVFLILLSDQLSVHAFKNVFMRLRPCYDPLIASQVYLLNGHCGGSYGFISSHAANTFALAAFLSLFFRGKIKNFGFFVFMWAALVAYSRIYSGVHYPGDVIVGALLGMGIGITTYKLYELAFIKISKTQ